MPKYNIIVQFPLEARYEQDALHKARELVFVHGKDTLSIKAELVPTKFKPHIRRWRLDHHHGWVYGLYRSSTSTHPFRAAANVADFHPNKVHSTRIV